MMEEMLEKLEELIARAERFEEVFEKKVESIAYSEQHLASLKKDLKLEVEELRTARHAVESSLTKNIENAIEKNINATLPRIMPQLIGEFVKNTESLSNAVVKKAISLNDALNTTINRAGHLIEDKKSAMTWRKAGLTFTFCFSSVLTALCINYFYPQYTHLNFDITPSMVKFSLLGEVAAEMYEKEFTQKQKDKLHEGLEKKYRASLVGPSR
jgi:ribosomal protein L16 Arg81 hydroxylase